MIEKLAKKAALDAAGAILKHFGNTKFKIKSDKSPQSPADLEANKAIYQALKPSGLDICSEEDIITKTNGDFWLVDPLDGTKDFLSKSKNFCTCIALISNSKAVFGLIYSPIEKELFFTRNNEVFLEKNGEIINLNKYQKNEKKLYISKREKCDLSYFSNLGFKTVYLSSALKFTEICKNGGIYLRQSPTHIWDNAAGDALINACGGKIIGNLKYELNNLFSPNFIALSKNNLHLSEEASKIFKF